MDCNTIATGIVAAVKETDQTSARRPARRQQRREWPQDVEKPPDNHYGDSMADAAEKVVKAVGE
jgi:hypothetical protein